jgi:hypothetical protein
MQLPDNSIIPSYLSLVSTLRVEDDGQFTNLALRYGEVDEIIYPNDKRSLSQKVVEYNVKVQHYDHNNGTSITKMYPHCVVATLFGGKADKFRYTLRAAKSGKKKPDETGLGQGSKVILLCLNGEQNQPIILSGIWDQTDDSEEKAKAKDLGHHLYWRFNGISAFINDDGELVVTYNGKQDVDGTLNSDVKEEQVGTRIQLLKNGNVGIRTKDDKQYIVINHEDGEIQQLADKEWHLNVSNGKTIIKSKGVELGDATDKMVLGTTYRKAEDAMLDDIQSACTGLLQKIATCGAALQAGALALTTSAAAASPSFDLAAKTFLQTIQDVQKISKAIITFKGKANTYLSDINLLD